MEPLLSIPQAARALGTSAVRIEAAAQLGALPALAAGSELYVCPLEAQRWLELVRNTSERDRRQALIERALRPSPAARMRQLVNGFRRIGLLGEGAA
jgi:hypothetical protein